ncbi:MAG: ABC transporter ATP-binding protein [Chthoniobacterales bacterium]
MATISLKNLTFSHPSQAAIRGVTLEIPDRVFAILTGPRGGGQSAILRLLAGLESAPSGEILLGDKKVNELGPSARDVAIVFADDALYPKMSIRQNIAFGLRQRKFSQTEITRRVEDAAGALGIAELLEKRPAEISLVERQRAALARAIARQSKVLLLDEPLRNLDAASRAQLRAELRKLHERLETTIVYGTSDATEAMALGEHVVILQDGRVAQEGTLTTVYEAPADLFVAGFLGEPPMNFVHGTLKLERDALLFRETGEGTIEARLALAERPAAAEFAGKAVVLGVRPEDLEIVSTVNGQEPPNSFPALVDFIEAVGMERTFHLQTGAHAIVARARGGSEEQPSGRRVRARFEERKVHLFDPESTRRIAGF